MKLIKKIIGLLLLALIALGLVAFGCYLATTKNVSLIPEKLLLNEKSIVLYDENLSPVQHVAGHLKQTVKISDIPEHTKQAFISVEDKRFYKHNGFDLKGIVRAALHNLKAGSFKEGASTISQQLIKNTHLSQEKTLKRKLREWKLTKQLEKRYTKDEILEKYLNTIYFGHNCFGITSAADFYFGKKPSELSLSDSAILAGLVKSPNNYSPFKNPTRCQARKNVVLNVMKKNEKITQTELTDALNAPLPLSNTAKSGGNYAHFVFNELTQISESNGIKIGGKIEIYTDYCPTLQAELERLSEEYSTYDKSIFILDNHTHGYKACLSTIGNAPRLPGSLLKPLAVYAPAIQENLLSPATPLLDEKVNYSGYMPENYDGQFHGYVSMRECVEKSLNIPAIKALQSLGTSKAAQYLQKLGLAIDKEDETLALALGGIKNGFPLQALTEAYSTFANSGNKYDCTFIKELKINGKIVYKRPKNFTKIFGEDSAYLMTDILKSTAQKGTAKKLRNLPFEIAAKTGTVGTKKGNTDAYALSYTTNDTIGVWFGNADNSFIETTGGGLPCNLLFSLNEATEKEYGRTQRKIAPFYIPKNVAKIALDKTAYYDTHTLLLADDNSPAEYQFQELFKTSAIPLNKSTSFSNPKIVTPQISLENNGVKIRFASTSPSYYQYRIERYDYATHTTLYDGNFIETFLDESIEENKRYEYVVTPIYNHRKGVSIKLPIISTGSGNKLQNDKIVDENWWEY